MKLTISFSFAGFNDRTLLAGHTMVLFADDIETSSIALSFALYDLANSLECRKKLYEEIIEKLVKSDGKWNADAVHCTENVLSPSCITWINAITSTCDGASNRRCTKEYRLSKNKRQTEGISIEPGTVVQIPIHAIQM